MSSGCPAFLEGCTPTAWPLTVPGSSRPAIKETFMLSRRNFLAAAGVTAGAATSAIASMPIPLAAAPDQAESPHDGTWLTYAVNVEMTWPDLPFLDRLRKVKEAGFSHYEFWPWR